MRKHRISIARCVLLLTSALVAPVAYPQSWSGATSGAWLDPTNWSGGVEAGSTAPGDTDIAVFNVAANPTIGIDMGATGGVWHLGAIDNTQATARIFNNSSTTTPGVLTLNGATVNAVANTILRNSTTTLMTLTNGTGSGTLGLELGNATANTIQITGTGGITIGGIMSGVGRSLRLQGGGSGALTLSGANTYSGGTTLAGGTVAVSNATSFGSGNVSVTASSRINSTAGNGVAVTYANAIDVGAALSLQNPQSATGATATFSGQLTGSGAITIVNGGGNGILAGLAFTNSNNTFTGNVILPSGSLAGDDRFSFNSIGDGGNFTFQKRGHQNAVIYTGSTPITFNTRSIALGGQFGGSPFDGGGVTPINRFMNNATDPAHTVTFNTNIAPATVNSSGYLFFDGSNTGNNTFAGTISNMSNFNLNIGKNGSGKWIFTGANSYSGLVIITQGTLSVDAMDVAANNQPLGKGALVQLGHQGTSGTLEFIGAANATTDKQVQIGNATAAQTGAGSILNNGAGTLTFSNPILNPTIAGITATRTLTLGGSNTGANTITGTIQNNNGTTGPVALTKTGTGTWVLAGANTFTGAVTITGTATSNTLRIEHNEALGPAATVKTVTLTGSNRQVSILELANNITVDINKTINAPGKSYMAAGETSFGSPVFLRNATGANTWLGNIIIATAGGAYSIESAAGTLTLGDPGTASVLRNNVTSSARTFDFRGAGDVVVNSRVIDNGTALTGLNKFGTGILTLPRTDNTATFTTPNFAAGTTVVENMADGGLPSSIGAGASFNFGGTFRHAGAADSSSNRPFGLIGATPTLESSGAGALALTSTTGVNLIAGASTTVAAFTTGATVLTAIAVHTLFPGMTIDGANIAPGTKITAIDYDTRQITLDTPTTGDQATHLAVNFSGSDDLDRTFTLGGANTGDNRIASPIGDPAGTGKLSLTKAGAGKWTLSGNNTYEGTTSVSQGTLLINGTHSGGGLISVSSGATLGGSGSMGPVTFATAGTLEPGDAERFDNWMEVGDLSLADPATLLDFELGAPDDGGTPLAANDLVIAASLALLRGQVSVIPQTGFASAPIGSKWRLIELTAGTVPAVNALTVVPALAGNYSLQAVAGDNAVYLVAVPEAGTGALCALALLLFGLRRRQT